jgi:hypothetical protein
MSTYDELERGCRQVLHYPTKLAESTFANKIVCLICDGGYSFHDSSNKKGTALRGSTPVNFSIEQSSMVNISASRQPGISLFGHDKVERRMS